MTTKAPTRVGAWYAGVTERVDGIDLLDLLTRTTLVSLIVVMHFDIPLMLLCAMATAAVWPQPKIRTSPWLWLGAAAVLTVALLPRWDRIDDHVWLAVYWTLALGLALTTARPERVLRLSGRLLLGLVFLLAFCWKIGTPEFRDTTFFQYSLLEDSRFEFVATGVIGVSDEAMDQNASATESLADDPHEGATVHLREVPSVGPVARVFTYWGILIEGLLALTWLAPLPLRARWVRHACLLAFFVTTYLVVPVGGFAVMLVTLALTQTGDPPDRSWRTPYLAAYLLLLAYGPVWQWLFGS